MVKPEPGWHTTWRTDYFNLVEAEENNFKYNIKMKTFKEDIKSCLKKVSKRQTKIKRN